MASRIDNVHRQRTLLKTAKAGVPSNSCHPELAEEPALSEAEWDHGVGSGCLLLGWEGWGTRLLEVPN